MAFHDHRLRDFLRYLQHPARYLGQAGVTVNRVLASVAA
jgi:hypothetical protein